MQTYLTVLHLFYDLIVTGGMQQHTKIMTIRKEADMMVDFEVFCSLEEIFDINCIIDFDIFSYCLLLVP